jgi:NAD(P)H-hydrate repair Nnr-like enzyme with NAD(P)H-hydrate epimerase domain
VIPYCADANHNGDADGIMNDRGCGNDRCWKYTGTRIISIETRSKEAFDIIVDALDGAGIHARISETAPRVVVLDESASDCSCTAEHTCEGHRA